MLKYFIFPLFLLSPFFLTAQQLAPLTVDKIMEDPSWIGTSPSQPFWSPNGQRLYFFWNPEKAPSDSLYYITTKNQQPQKANLEERQLAFAKRDGVFNNAKDKLIYTFKNSLILQDLSSSKRKTLLHTTKSLSSLSFGQKLLFFQMDKNLYSLSLSTHEIKQLTDFQSGKEPKNHKELSRREKFLKGDALINSTVLRRRKQEEKAQKELKEKRMASKPKTIYYEDKNLSNIQSDPTGHYITYRLTKKTQDKNTKVPDYVTESGYIKNLSSRPKVGIQPTSSTTYIYNTQKDSSYPIITKNIPGIKDIPSFYKNYSDVFDSLQKDPPVRKIVINGPKWNKNGTKALVVIRSLDHKDRWLMLLEAETGKLKLLDRQHDSAWIAGPGIGYTYSLGNVGWLNENTIWYQSEKTGYSHLYTQNVITGKQQALTEGNYEIQEAQLSPNKQTFYLTTNEIAPGEKQFYHLNIKNKKKTRITQKAGGNDVTVSPNGHQIAFLHSTITHPWELYIKENKAKGSAQQITDKAESSLYQSYDWQVPEVTTFTDRDGYQVYTKIYKPKQQAASKPGVIFVHGAGYLQDVTHYWSYYFREHFFMNLLANNGYTVLDIDYRGSAGYGRNWRTAIYRHMGKNDLADIVDGAKYMVKELNVNPDKIGLWGGSYGGFMTLSALFKTDIFACGAALRSVTDWAHYNHGYTSNILNLPQNDSIAYVQSSPIYFAEGLHAPLLMCHGLIDTNVHFQDIIRLTEKLIELKKNGWDLAVYPLESHAFVEPESWRDEYHRIFRLFERYLK